MRKTNLLFVLIAMFFSSMPIFATPYGTKHCKDSQYTCYTVKRGDTWKKLFPDDDERDLVMKINRMNTPLYRGLVIALPKSNNADVLALSPLPSNINPPGRKVILVSLKDLAFGAYNPDGHLVHWGPVSAARGYCPDIHRHCSTRTGTFEIYTRGGAGCKSTRYPIGRGGAPMPYCMFFNGNFALHGSYEVPGYHASHGCIRLFVNDARWLNQDFTAGDRTKVKVY